MTCYMRHLHDLFEALDLEYDASNRKRVDAAIRGTLGLTDDDACPQVWSAIKALPADERAGLPASVAERLT